MLICMENCIHTYDHYITQNALTEDQWLSSFLQIIMILLTYQKYLTENIKVMDTSAIAIARDNKIPIKLFSILEKNCFLKMYNNKIKYSEIS